MSSWKWPWSSNRNSQLRSPSPNHHSQESSTAKADKTTERDLGLRKFRPWNAETERNTSTEAQRTASGILHSLRDGITSFHEPVLIFSSESGLANPLKIETREERQARDKSERVLQFYTDLFHTYRATVIRGDERWVLRNYGQKVMENLKNFVEMDREKYAEEQREFNRRIQRWGDDCDNADCIGWPGSELKRDVELEIGQGGHWGNDRLPERYDRR